MISKKASLLISDTAKDLNLDPELVDSVVSFFWQEIRNSLTNVDYHRLSILNLGTFEVTPKKVAEKIEKYTQVIAKAETLTYGSAHKYNIRKAKLEKMIKIKELLDKEYQNKQAQRKLRHG